MALSRSPKPMMRVRFFPFLPIPERVNKSTILYKFLTIRLWLFYLSITLKVCTISISQYNVSSVNRENFR